MGNIKLVGLLLGFGMAVAPQLTAQANLSGTVQTPANADAITVPGPVVADYGKNITGGNSVEEKIAKEVRHELLMLPYYSLFDNLGYSVEGRTVTLTGTLTSKDAVTKRDAETAVKRMRESRR